MMPIKVKVIYEGVGPGYMAKVVDAETGALLEGVTSCDIHIDTNNIPVARFEVQAPVIDVICNVDLTDYGKDVITKAIEAYKPVTVTEVKE